MTGSVLGIDFGTSNSAAGMLLDGRPHLFEMEDGERTLPTSFFFEFDTKETLIGTPAVRALIDGNEGRFMRALKRVLGTSLMHERRSLLGRQVGRPVRFHGEDMEKEARAEADLRACYLAAGFQEVSFIAEPEAAALASGVDLSGPSKGLIVDIGGGTSDFSLFQQGAGGGVEIIANHGVRIGGTDFDRSLSIECVMPLLGRGSLIGQVLGDGRQPAPNAIFNDLATWEKIPFLYAGKTRKMVAEMEKLALEPVKLGRLAEVLRSELGHDLAFAVEAGKIEANARTQALIDLGVIETGLVADETYISARRAPVFRGFHSRGGWSGDCIRSVLTCQLHPNRYVIRGLLAVADFFVDLAVQQKIGRLRIKQEVIDPDPVVAVPRTGLIIPECVGLRGDVSRPQSLGEAQVEDLAKRSAAFGKKESVVEPNLGSCGIFGLGDYVVVSGH